MSISTTDIAVQDEARPVELDVEQARLAASYGRNWVMAA